MQGKAIRDGMITESDSGCDFITPKLVEEGWCEASHVLGEQRNSTNGNIIMVGGKVRCGKQNRADYFLFSEG